jgi:hypothetical protein
MSSFKLSSRFESEAGPLKGCGSALTWDGWRREERRKERGQNELGMEEREEGAREERQSERRRRGKHQN